MLQLILQIYFKPEGIQCSHDEKDDCKHIQFALSKPDIRAVVKQRRKEGWKLPIV